MDPTRLPDGFNHCSSNGSTAIDVMLNGRMETARVDLASSHFVGGRERHCGLGQALEKPRASGG